MPQYRRPSGLIINLPETFRVTESVEPKTTRRGRRLPTGPVRMATGGDAGESRVLLSALADQEMELADEFDLEPTVEPTPPSGQRRGGAPVIAESQQAELQLEVDQNEDAVLLVEQDGMYSWLLAQRSEILPAQAPMGEVRRTRGAPGSLRRVEFRIEIHAQRTPGATRTRQGLISEILFDRIKVYALTFVARIAVGQTVKFLERHVKKGLVQMTGVDPAAWGHNREIKLPQDRPARILLFVHGTFSSSIGSFGALCGTPWGQAFLTAVSAHFDAVLGFDHATLADDPMTNASELLSSLEALAPKHPPLIDAIAYSRGGLVLRSLIEHLLPNSSFRCRLGTAIFVACTNAGTELANPDNWHTLIDVYTNIAVAAFRLLSLLPQANAAALVLKELVQSLGTLVKFLATEATGGVPGLAAMRPDGDFVTTINKIQENQPAPADVTYFAVTSEFRPQLSGGDHKPKEFPMRLAMALADGLVDQVMGAANDLVVDTFSMTAIDLEVGGFIRDSLAFGATPVVYHTCYFTQPLVVNACTRWLQLPAPVSAAAGTSPGAPMVELTPLVPRRLRGTRRPAAPVVKILAPLPAAEPSAPVPAAVDTDIVVTMANSNAGEVLELLHETNPSYVVVRRPHEGEVLHYAFRTEEVLNLENSPELLRVDLTDALNLHESDRSDEQSLTSVRPVEGSHGASPARRGVVMVNGRPLGVVPEAEAPLSADELVAMAQMAAEPLSAADFAAMRRAMPTFAPPSAAAPDPQKATCHVLAEMEGEVVVNRATTMTVSVSREQLAQTPGMISGEAVAQVDPTKKLLIQVIPRTNFTVIGDDRAEIDYPAAGGPALLYFDVKGTHLGEGEIWVAVRQRQMGVAQIVLRPRIVERALAAWSTRGEATAVEAPALTKPLYQLLIVEQNNGHETSFFYELDFPGQLNVFNTYSSKPLKVHKAKYVEALYKEIEQRWISNFNEQARKADIEAFTEELRAFGASLFDELFPVEMQEILWKHRDQLKSILVVSTEPFIPWEIVHLKEPGQKLGNETRFLAQMGLVRWLHNVGGLPPEVLTIRNDKARVVIPDYPHKDFVLPEAQAEREFLEKELRAKSIEPQPNPVRKILQQPGSFDLLHFACHGEAEGDNITNARLVLEGYVDGQNYVPTYINATTVEQFANLRNANGSRPVVVLNACQVGRAGYKLTGIGGFAQAFLGGGAGLFVGTLWSVGDSPARTFTETFYKELKADKTVADAAIAAREGSRAAGDATWLAYVVYGHPHAKVNF